MTDFATMDAVAQKKLISDIHALLAEHKVSTDVKVVREVVAWM
jgi:hypothetical protein